MNKEMQGFTINSHFESRDPVVRNIYDQLKKAIKRFGPIVEEPKKTSIHIVNRTALAGVATRKGHLVLTIKSDRKLASPRIHKSEQTSASRFHHEVKLTSPADVDAELIGWLKAAYSLSA
jgi:Domain of unknown function (DUF5655)